MNPQAIISTISLVIGLAAQAIELGRDAAPYAQALFDTFKGGTDDVSQEELDALVVRVTAMHNEFQEPLAGL